METIARTDRRLDDMTNLDAPYSLRHTTPNSLKRKEISGNDIGGVYSRESMLLGPFEKRMRGLAWPSSTPTFPRNNTSHSRSPHPRESSKRMRFFEPSWPSQRQAVPRSQTRESTFSFAARGAFPISGESNGNLLGFSPLSRAPHFSVSEARRGVASLVHSPFVEHTRIPHMVSRYVPFDMDDEVLPSSPKGPVIVPEPGGMSDQQKDMYIADLEQKVKDHEKFSRGAMNSLEMAEKLFLNYKQQVNSRKESNKTKDGTRQAREDMKRRSDLTRGPDFFLSEEAGHSMLNSNGSFSKEFVVAGDDISHAASLHEADYTRHESQGHDSLHVSGGGDIWRQLYDQARAPAKIDKLNFLQNEIEVFAQKFRSLQLSRPATLKEEKKSEVEEPLIDAFTPLSDDAEYAVNEALEGGDRSEVLVTHEKSNIDVTRIVLQCLLPGAWLNDEVINVYMELLKERELREPERFLKCHFFNTFFYNKLYRNKHVYDYKAIRRWTTPKKLGYSLSECDKILVPIHQDIHWCLAVINIRDKRFEYLDSLKGGDGAVLKVLSRYIADEVQDKDGKALDVSTWVQDFPQEIPEQLNGCDCGMFMVKYADFHSRDAPLTFTQEHMSYFRRKMVWEILQLKAT